MNQYYRLPVFTGMDLLQFTDKGIYCAQADVYIDPWRPVQRALITHGHADHARPGHSYYLCTHAAKPVIRYRLGGHIRIESVDYGEVRTINGVRFSFHPAGHIIGSAQIRVEYQGEVWVTSGDYKLENDGLSGVFEPVPCHTFITESTFGLPVYKWPTQAAVFQEINNWWQANNAEGKVSVLTGYSLGKAQRLLQHLDTGIGRIYTHGAIENTNAVLRNQGIKLADTIRVTPTSDKRLFPGSLILAPPSVAGSVWLRKFKNTSLGMASGWMSLRGARRRRAADRGFVLSDHADWESLNTAIKATGATRILVTHGYTQLFAQWLREQGYDAQAVRTEYEGELSEMSETADSDISTDEKKA